MPREAATPAGNDAPQPDVPPIGPIEVIEPQGDPPPIGPIEMIEPATEVPSADPRPQKETSR